MIPIQIRPQPGVMIYDDCFAAMNNMPDNESVALLRAMFEYKNTGKEPDFPPYSQLSTSWAFVHGKLEIDRQKYIKKVLNAKYCSYVKECRKDDIDMLCFEDWEKYYRVEFVTT